MAYILVSIISLFVGAYLHHLIYSRQHAAALEQANTARDKHNHYAERYKQEAMKAYKDGVEIRTQEKLQSYERSYNR